MLELYNAPHSTCSQKVRICLHEKELDWTDHQLDLAAKDQLKRDYLRLNPNGVVPTLVHDGRAIVDSSVIVEYVDEVFPGPELTPRDPVMRAQMRAWMRYLEEVPTAAVRVPSFNLAFLHRFGGLSQKQFFDQQADIRPIRKHFYRRMGPTGFSDSDFEASLEQMSRTVERMEKALEKHDWLVGEHYTLADLVVAPLLDRMADLGLAYLWEADSPAVTAWFGRMKDRPAYRKTFYPGARLSETHSLRPPSARPARPSPEAGA